VREQVLDLELEENHCSHVPHAPPRLERGHHVPPPVAVAVIRPKTTVQLVLKIWLQLQYTIPVFQRYGWSYGWCGGKLIVSMTAFILLWKNPDVSGSYSGLVRMHVYLVQSTCVGVK
jgi:hypothetical protein